MDLTKEYRLMCLEAIEIQNNWEPENGDFMVTKSTYCEGEENEDNCSDEKPCSDCLEMGNVYVISGKYDYAESVGGTHWFFGGGACVRGEGNMCNDTYCSIMSESGYSTILPSRFKRSKNEMLWLPRQDQIQSMFLNGLTEQYKVRKFIEWLDVEADYNPHTYSLEMLWLMFYMYEVCKKQWNATSNIKKWENVCENNREGVR